MAKKMRRRKRAASPGSGGSGARQARGEKQRNPGSAVGAAGRTSELRLDLLWAAGLTLLAWAHRYLFLLSNRDRDWPFTIFYQGDAKTFFLHARALLSGELYDQGIPFHPPGFPGLLAGLHSLVGAGGPSAQVPHMTVKVILAFLSSLAVGLLYLLVRPYSGRPVAVLAALICVYHFGLYVFAIAPVSEGVYLSLLILALLIWSRGLGHPLSAPDAEPLAGRAALLCGLGLGVLFGLMALMRFESTLVGMVLGAIGLGSAILVRFRDSPGAREEGDVDGPARADSDRWAVPRPSPIAVWLLMAVGWWLAVAPWTARNHQRLVDYNTRMGESLAEPLPTFVPVTLYGPINLALANSAEADGGFSPEAVMGRTGDAALDFTKPHHLEFVLHGDAMARQWISENPGDWARLVWRKWDLYSDALELGFLQGNWPGGLVGERRPVDIFVADRRGLGIVLGALVLVGLGLAAFGVRASAGGRRWSLVVGLLALAGLGTTAFFFGYARQGLLLFPFLATLIAVPLVEGWERAIRRAGWQGKTARKRLGWLGIALVVILLGVEIHSSGADRNFRASASSTLDGHHLNPDDAIRLELIEP